MQLFSHLTTFLYSQFIFVYFPNFSCFARQDPLCSKTCLLISPLDKNLRITKHDLTVPLPRQYLSEIASNIFPLKIFINPIA